MTKNPWVEEITSQGPWPKYVQNGRAITFKIISGYWQFIINDQYQGRISGKLQEKEAKAFEDGSLGTMTKIAKKYL